MADTLIDCSTFFIDNNVNINVGLDPEQLFNCMVHVFSNSQCMKMSTDFFKSILPLFDNMHLSTLTNVYSDLYQMHQCGADKILCIKGLQDDKCILLTEDNLKRIFQMRDAIEEVIDRKEKLTRGIALHQACKLSLFLGIEMPIPKNTNLKDVEDYVKRISVQQIKDRLPIDDPCFIAELKLNACRQLARGWLASSTESQSKVNRPWKRAFKARDEVNRPQTRAFLAHSKVDRPQTRAFVARLKARRRL